MLRRPLSPVNGMRVVFSTVDGSGVGMATRFGWLVGVARECAGRTTALGSKCRGRHDVGSMAMEASPWACHGVPRQACRLCS